MSAQSDIKAMILAAILTDDAQSVAESVTYTPASGTARTIAALVLRRQPAPYGNSISPVLQVSVANDGTEGISSASINAGSDTITVAERPGGTPAARNIGRIITSNAAYMTLELR
jgi:hypothetical protein